jgi:hypothetical protein
LDRYRDDADRAAAAKLATCGSALFVHPGSRKTEHGSLLAPSKSANQSKLGRNSTGVDKVKQRDARQGEFFDRLGRADGIKDSR